MSETIPTPSRTTAIAIVRSRRASMARVSSGTSPGALPGNPRVYYAYQIVADASTLTLGEEPILHSLGVTRGREALSAGLRGEPSAAGECVDLSFIVAMATRHQGAAMARNLLFFLSRENLNFIRSQSQCFEPLGGSGPNWFAVLSDAAGKDQDVRSPQQGNVGADHLAYRHCKNLQRQS